MRKLFLFLIPILFISGCNSTNEKVAKSINDYDTSNMGVINCSRDASNTNLDANLQYKLYHVGNVLKILESTEAVTTTNKDTLEEYYQAYQKISDQYKELEYYVQTVNIKKNTVTNQILINYEKINIQKLIEIEGNNDEVYSDDGKVYVDKWIEFAEKFGTECEE